MTSDSSARWACCGARNRVRSARWWRARTACLAGTGVLFGDLDDLALARGLRWSRVLFSLFVVVGTTFLGALVREQRRLEAVEAQQVDGDHIATACVDYGGPVAAAAEARWCRCGGQDPIVG